MVETQTPTGWRRQAPAAAALLVLAAAVAAHAALIPGGRWQGDEYGAIAAYRDQGLSFLRYRLLHWSPRPVSEPLIYAYARLVLHWRQPLIAPVLAMVWALLVAAAVGALCWRGGRPVWRGLIVASVLAACLLGHPVGEMFYWPMGALAYLPALAGLTAATFLIVRGLDRPATVGARLACGAALLLAAGSAELGAMATLCVCGLIGLTELPGLARAARRTPVRLAAAAWWAVPLLAAAAILLLLLTGRAGAGTEAQGAVAHHVWPSLAAAARGLGLLLVAPGAVPEAPPPTLLPSIAWWLPLLFLGLAGAWRHSGAVAAPARHLWALAAGLLLGAYASLASAAWQFGVPCCERHDSFRACLAVLALAALAARVPVPRMMPAAAWPLLLLLGLLPPALPRGAAWWAEFRQLGAEAAVRQATWASGEAPGAAMTFRQPLPPHVVNDGALPARGRFDADSAPWFIAGVLQFFGKWTVDVVGR